MGVGSLRNPREYDGRLPPAAGYYLNLVLPRFEEPRKKIGSQVRLLHGRILQIRRSIHMQSSPRTSVNLPVILVKILVNLPVKLTNFRKNARSTRGRCDVGRQLPRRRFGSFGIRRLEPHLVPTALVALPTASRAY